MIHLSLLSLGGGGGGGQAGVVILTFGQEILSKPPTPGQHILSKFTKQSDFNI